MLVLQCGRELPISRSPIMHHRCPRPFWRKPNTCATVAIVTVVVALAVACGAAADPLAFAQPQTKSGPLDPRGKMHIPIGIANTVDTLKTFVEACLVLDTTTA